MKKLTGKVAMVSDLIQVIKRSLNPKGRDSMRSPSVHGRKKNRVILEYVMSIQKPIGQIHRIGVEQKGRPYGGAVLCGPVDIAEIGLVNHQTERKDTEHERKRRQTRFS
ncbi:hypothetical protein [Bacillus nitroreducens]